MRLPRSQRGLAAATIIIVLILAAVALLLGRSAWRSAVELDRRGVTDASLARVSKALVEFASLNRRLPCPARGNLDTGDADPDAATATCTTADGVVPWRTLALRSEDALDGWGRKISYRVFDGAAGLTQADGASMSNCNTSLGAPIDATLAAGSLCKPGGPPPNTPAQFLAARAPMLVVEDQGTTRNGNAFVLISHGETGYGAYVAEAASGRTTLPSAGGKEIVNTQAGGTYWILPQSAPGVAAGRPGPLRRCRRLHDSCRPRREGKARRKVVVRIPAFRDIHGRCRRGGRANPVRRKHRSDFPLDGRLPDHGYRFHERGAKHRNPHRGLHHRSRRRTAGSGATSTPPSANASRFSSEAVASSSKWISP